MRHKSEMSATARCKLEPVPNRERPRKRGLAPAQAPITQFLGGARILSLALDRDLLPLCIIPSFVKMVRQFKHHEQKLLKKVDFLNVCLLSHSRSEDRVH